MHPQPNGQWREPVTTVQLLPLPQGLYAFSATEPRGPVPDGSWLPALEISVPPGSPEGQFRLLDADNPSSAWLKRGGEPVIGKVTGTGCKILVTSFSMSQNATLALNVQRLSQASPTSTAPAVAEPVAVPKPPIAADGRRTVPLRLVAHVQKRGDLKATDCVWAGQPGSGLQLEAFAVQPLQDVAPEDIEYKAVSADGVELPWVRGGEWCGTRGKGLAILGFALRLNPAGAAFYDIEYGAATRSGAILTPVKNGLPCRSRHPNDPIEALWVRLVERRVSEAVAGQL